MNKQEVIDEIENAIPDYILNDYQRGKEAGLIYALELVNQLDEPKKPVIPQFIDTWIQGAKYNGFDLYEAMTDETPDKTSTWIVCNSEIFAKAWFFGYELEKEKLYTARLGIIYIERESYINKDTRTDEIFLDDLTDLDGKFQIHFTQAELEKLDVWNNPAFEVKEVKK